MLFEIGVADAYGGGFELAPDEVVAKNNDLAKFHRCSKYNPTVGRYTDDTQMSLAVAEAILTGDWFDERNYARCFVEAYKRDPGRGYARGFGKLLSSVKDGNELLRRIVPASERGGAAMRAIPLGLLPKLGDVQFACTIQATITHRTSAGIRAALAIATASHLLARTKVDPWDLVRQVEKSVPGSWGTWTGRVSLNGEDIARAAIAALVTSDSLSEILKKSVAYGGDTDTVAAIAVGMASLSKHFKKDLPKALTGSLEKGKYGGDYLKKLDDNLLKRF